jgi:hypothetical protein
MDVIAHIKVGGLKWAGHLFQMNDQQPAKGVFIVKPEKKQNKGKTLQQMG